MEINIAGEKLLLSESKVIYWSRQQTLFIADLHLGKTSHFRKSGIAIPLAIVKAEIDRIENTILKFRPKKVFFLGDLFHSDLNHEWSIFTDFIEQYGDIQFTLIKGNHDILNDSIYKMSSLQIEKEPFLLTPFVLSHHPLNTQEIDDSQMNLCGHLHPGISIKGKGKSDLTLACFYLLQNKLILPAFGRFTGLAKIKLEKAGSAYAILNNSVLKIG